MLDLSSNGIRGKVPGWVINISVDSFNISFNFLTGFHDQHPILFSGTNYASILDLSSNNLQGSLTVPPIGTFTYLVSNNSLTGEIPTWICKLESLVALDLSYNNLSGNLPQCLGSFSPGLSILQLSRNKFCGSIPETFVNGYHKMIDLSYNLLHGRIPISLANCTMLEFLNLGNNQINDIFPSWLGALPYLQISNILVAIILSGNKFDGEIPTSIANLREVHILNLSHNSLQGHIPSQLTNITSLESLDLSNNKLSGQIPQNLIELTFLGYFNVSHNNLTGPIPQGNQFTLFDNSSFDGNLGLCGKPLSRKCENDDSKPNENEDVPDSKSSFALDWKTALIGYSGGLIVGVILGLNFCTGIQEWFVEKILGRRSKRRRKKQNGIKFS
ncbi:putative Leucine-rich receptor-like kinase family protein [Melia azedarach]|uniref:Leucine-rich receptor-like kinase family protein n=1 Tax=Melia azedarach TaxID=155640 RepID=A0ACC1Y3T2_MELAZ|nr:putative Leucine-rich receptor-like kinase family protein [Melia azedarach]